MFVISWLLIRYVREHDQTNTAKVKGCDPLTGQALGEPKNALSGGEGAMGAVALWDGDRPDRISSLAHCHVRGRSMTGCHNEGAFAAGTCVDRDHLLD